MDELLLKIEISKLSRSLFGNTVHNNISP